MTTWSEGGPGAAIRGAAEVATKYTRDGWASMDTAPRDGTIIEIKNCYGVAPYYGLFRWMADDGYGSSGWRDPADAGHGLMDDIEHKLFWRPYAGDVASYRDPTQGLQNTSAYWRGACAAEHGLPSDYFENTAPAKERGVPSLLGRVLSWFRH